MPIVLLSSRRRFTYTTKVTRISVGNLAAYWTLGESVGNTAVDASGNGGTGAYNSVAGTETFGQGGIGDGKTSVVFGASGFCDIAGSFLTAFNSKFNGQEFTIGLWCKATSLGGNGRSIYIIVDASNRVYIERLVDNTFNFVYIAGGTAKGVNVGQVSATQFVHVALAVSKSGGYMKAYRNGGQVGTTQTSLGTWAGALTGTTIAAINNAAGIPWTGALQHVAVWNTALSDAQIANLAVVT